MECLLNEVGEFEKKLNQAEQYLTTHTQLRKPIIKTLDDLHIFETDEKFIRLVPNTILLCHYVEFRMALRK